MIPKIVREFFKNLPHFPDGRINYTNSNKAAVLTCFLKYKDKILLLKRSQKVGDYKGKWHGIGGYYDELKPLEEIVKKEIKEELGIGSKNIRSFKIAKTYRFKDKKINKTWFVHPVLIELKNKPKIKLDWEHQKYQWIKPEELKKFDFVPNLDKLLKMLL